jgi:hypothetical protein
MTRDQKIAICLLVVATLTLIGAFVIPEVRKAIGLDKPVQTEPVAAQAVKTRLSTPPALGGNQELDQKRATPASTSSTKGATLPPVQTASIPADIQAEDSLPGSLPPNRGSYTPRFAFLIGEWESLTPGNHWRMRVRWDGQSGQFQGYLIKQGIASENVGFEIGEPVWIAEPVNEHTLVERQKLRRGSRVSSDYEWTNGNVDLERSARDRLVGNVEFMRVRQ